MNQGFLTYALNSHAYLQLAVNLASTIKMADYEARISLVTNLDPGEYAGMFDKVIRVTEHNPFELKTRAYELSPYKQTFFVDADTVFNHTKFQPGQLFTQVDGIDLSFPVLAVDPPAVSWVKLPDFKTWAALESPYPALYSGLFYFRKCRAASSYFKAAQKLYGTYPECDTLGIYYPDEPFFSMAAAKKNLLFGELNGYIYKADQPNCNESAILGHAFMTMPGTPSREHIRLYNALVIQAGRLGFPVQRYQK